MKTARILVVAVAMILAFGTRAGAQVATGSEALAVSTGAVPITSTVYRPAAGGIEATNCFFVVEDADIRYRVDGGTPTASVGTPANQNSTVPLNADSIALFEAIRAGGVDAVLQVSCFTGDPGSGLPIPVPTEVLSTISGAVAAELADVTATSEELNVLDGIASGLTAAELSILDGVTSTFTKLNYTDVTTLGTQEASLVVTTDANVNSGVSKLTELHIGATGAEVEVTATPIELNKTDGLNASAYLPVTDGCVFQANATNTTYTCTVEVPAGSILENIQVVTTVLWTDGSAATMVVGDDDAADGWFTTTDVEATDLVLGEVLSINAEETWGGNNGAYLVAATGVRGQAVAAYSGTYVVAAAEVIGVITVTAPDSAVGTTIMVVTYTTPTLTSSTNTGS